jgi:hypothetical protein
MIGSDRTDANDRITPCRRRSPRRLRALGSIAILAALAACSQSPRQSALQESARYVAHAHRNYTPPGPPEDPWGPYVRQASARFDMPETWVRSVMRVESGGQEYVDGNLVTSGAGAMGLMQVMPETYAEMRAQYGLGKDPYDPHDNVLAGTAYLKWLHFKYGYPAMFAAYNDGPGNIELNMAGNHPLPAETVAYLANIRARLGDTAPADNNRLNLGPGSAKPAMATLTRPDGQTVTIAGLDVKSVRAVLPGEYPDSAAAVIEIGKNRQAVREDVASATRLLRQAGAKL